MAKIYGTPIMAGGAGGANKDLPPLLDNFKAFEGDGTKLKDLPSGSKVKLGKWNAQDLQWILARDSVTQELRLVLDDESMSAIGHIAYDAKEPNNINDSFAADYGHAPYSVSNIHQWLNSDGAAGSWYTPAHQYDAAPDYATTKAGFLNEWSDGDKTVLQIKSWPTAEYDMTTDSLYSSVNTTSLIALISLGELGDKDDDKQDHRLDIFNNLDYIAVDLNYWTRNAYYVVPPTSGFVNAVDTGGSIFAPSANTDGTGDTIMIYPRPICAPNPEAVVSETTDSDGCYTIDYDAFYVTIQADKMAESRANELAGAVWVYGDHEPTSVNDGTKIQLTREEVVTSDGGEAQTVTKTVEWNIEANFFARQFTYNSKKQYQTMLEGAVATIMLLGVPAPVS